MPNYQLSKIYKIYSPSKNLIYIGSTTQTLSQRLASHLRDKKNYDIYNTKKYYSSYLVLDCEDYKIELLEDYACNNRQQLCKKEGEYIKNNECVNECVAGRTDAEYYRDNIDKIKEQRNQYHIDNIDKIKEKVRLRNQTEERIKYMKQYNIDNNEKLTKNKKQYYLKKKAIQSSD